MNARKIPQGVLIVLFLVLACGSARAEEPASEFLGKLREQGLFDLAHEYLERMEKSPLVPQDFRQTIPFEQALTLMAVSRTETDFVKRQTRLDEAQKKFEEFLTAQKNHDFAPKAKGELANVLVERARVKLAEAARPQNAAKKNDLLKEARGFFEKALIEFKNQQEEINKKLGSLPKQLDEKKDAKRIAYRDELRKDYVSALMVQAVILYDMASTATDKKEKDDYLKRAADAYGAIHEKYRTRLAGLYARLQQGKCYQEMGGDKNLQEALSFYAELLEQPDKPDPFRGLRTKTLVQTLQCWLSDDIKDKKIDPAIKVAAEWVIQMRPNEAKDDDWLTLHHELCRAYRLKLADEKLTGGDRNKIKDFGKDLAQHGVKYATTDDLKKHFAEHKVAFGGKVDPTKKVDPKNFAEAYDAATEAWDQIRTLGTTIGMLEERLKTSTDKAAQEEATKLIASSKESQVTARTDAIKYFSKALSMVEPETKLDEVNNCRYYLCSLYWSQKDYYESAAYGEFLARYSPGHAAAKYCGTLARGSYLSLYNEAPEDDRDFETERVINICNYIYSKWPTDTEGQDALISLIKFMVQPKKVGNTRVVPPENLEKAKDFLSKVAADSPRRGEAELTAGQAMWSSYLKGMQQTRKWEKQEEPVPEGVDPAARKIELDGLKKEAEDTLKNGVDRMKAKGIDKTLAAAVLSLCQIYVDTGQAAKAIALLEDPEIGAMTLVKAKHEAVQREGVMEETYRTALRAYIGALASATDKAAMVAKAEAVMDELNKTVGVDDAGKEKLVTIYVTLASEVKQLIDLTPPAQRPAIILGFTTFLEKVSSSTTDFTVVYWVARSFFELGEQATPAKGEPTPEAKNYYDKAAKQYTVLLEKAKTDKSITPEMQIQLRLNSADVLRRQGKYVLAMDQYEEILKQKERNSMLNVQILAAETYVQWAETGVPSLYIRAVNGGRKNSKDRSANNIWGYGTIAKRLNTQMVNNPALRERFYDTYHQARFNQASAYYLFGLKKSEKEERDKNIGYTKSDIRKLLLAHPDVGGQKWRKQYDELLKKAQTALNEKPEGLAGLEAEIAKAAAATAAATPPATGTGGGTATANSGSGSGTGTKNGTGSGSGAGGE